MDTRSDDSKAPRVALDWPLPPTLEVVPGGEAAGREGCVVQLAGGERLAGVMTRFAPGSGKLGVIPVAETEERIVDIAGMVSVKLLRALSVKHRPVPLAEHGGDVHAPSELQPFSLELADGQALTGETMGHVVSGAGLFLFVSSGPGAVVRHFFPWQAVRTRSIGLPIGEALARINAVDREGLNTAVERQRRLRSRRLGDYLAEERLVTREQLELALKHQEEKPILRLGEALVQLGLISPEQLDAALKRQRSDRGKPLGQILTEMGLVTEDELRTALARKLGIPFVGLRDFIFDPDAIARLGATAARRGGLVPLFMHESAIVVAFENPLDPKVIEDVQFATECRVIPAMASREEILQAIASQYGTYGAARKAGDAIEYQRDDFEFHRASAVDVEKLAASLPGEDQALALVDDAAPASDSALVQLVNKIVLDAWADGVSDIHVESNAGHLPIRIRFRKDGTLLDYLEVPAASRSALVSRLKIMAQLDISERRRPQDGKIAFRQYGPADVELRIATIPTSAGLEDVVMRLLSATRPVLLAELGLAPASREALELLMEKPYGLLLACGPTGSGKTTTLHSLLSHINVPGRKIWTAEDPIEITQRGLRQVQVNAKIGWTFAAALRSFLRADPDVVMVGEMRDAETARAGIEASLTGHLVLSTLHTNSAPESIVRLLDMGMDPFNFADSLLAVLAQRLPKTLCPHCKRPRAPDPGELESLAAEYCVDSDLRPEDVHIRWVSAEGGPRLHRAEGCPKCGGTGYLGRAGIHELLVMTPTLRHLVQTRAPVSEVSRIARSDGMRTLKQDGIEKVLAGLTDLVRIRAVCS
jgi:type II secretory ATPase GspE/PulE/Tfp pilus assembly ATPase PilB-like protein